MNDMLHIINNMGSIMRLCSVEVSRLSARQLDFHTQPGGGKATRSLGGEGGSERAGQGGRGGWCRNPLSTASPYVFKVCFHIVKCDPRGGLLIMAF